MSSPKKTFHVLQNALNNVDIGSAVVEVEDMVITPNPISSEEVGYQGPDFVYFDPAVRLTLTGADNVTFELQPVIGEDATKKTASKTDLSSMQRHQLNKEDLLLICEWDECTETFNKVKYV